MKKGKLKHDIRQKAFKKLDTNESLAICYVVVIVALFTIGLITHYHINLGL